MEKKKMKLLLSSAFFLEQIEQLHGSKISENWFNF